MNQTIYSNATGKLSSPAAPNAKERQNRFKERQAMVQALEEADAMTETQKLKEQLDKKIRILSLSKSKERKSNDYTSTIAKINKDVGSNERPNTAIIERVQS